MSTARKPKSMSNGRPDDFQTPAKALVPLLPYLRPGWTIWEPACGKGNLVRALEGDGFRVIASDVKDGRDFRNWQPDQHWDCCLTNPPFSLKHQFLARAYDLGRAFAFLLPLTTFETADRQGLFRRNGLEVIFIPFRVDFETPSGQGSSAWFATAWFTHGLGIGQQMTFWEPPSGQPALFGGDL